MKKIYFSILSILMLTCIIGLSACQEAKHEHDYKSYVYKEATCSEEGITEKLCLKCGDKKYEVIEKNSEHNYDWVITKEATCTEFGVKKGVCLDCEAVVEESSVPKLNHTEGDWKVVSNATCTQNGIKQKACEKCDTVLKIEEIAKLNHTESEWKVISNATCTQNGVKQKVCEECSAVLKTEEITKLNHTASDWKVINDSNCTEKGLERKTCVDCDTILEESFVSKTNHTASDWKVVSNASCTQNGIKQKICVDCNVVLEIEEIAKLDHVESDWKIISNATCSQNGVKQKACVDCNTVLEIKELEKLSHTVNDWVVLKEASCLETGFKAGNCSGCGEELTLTIPKEEHEFEYGRCVKCFSMNIVANLLENEKLGYSIAEVFETIEKYGYNVDSYYLDLFARICAKNNIVECSYNYSGVDFSLSIENMVSDFAVDSQYNLLIDGINIYNEYVNIIYKDGSVIRAGAIDELVGENIIGYEGIIKSIAINNQNQLLVVYEDNSVVLYGVVSNEISSVVPGMLYMKNGDTYSCLGFLDKNNRQTEINVAPSHKGELVDSIAQGAFFENKNLEKVVLSNEIKTIEDYAFYYCSKLREVDLGDSLEKIGEDAFSYCAIEQITIPVSCTEISRFAFYNCENLSKIYYEGTIEQWQEINIEKYWKLDTPTIQIICTNGTISVN